MGTSTFEYLSHNKKVLLTTMLAKGSLWKYLQEIDKQSQEMFEALVEDMCIDNDITEDLKENDQMKWVQENESHLFFCGRACARRFDL